MPGWQQSTEHCRTLEDLPKQALDYLKFLAELMEVPIALVSLGASRDQTIIVEDPIHGPKRALLHANGTPVTSGVWSWLLVVCYLLVSQQPTTNN